MSTPAGWYPQPDGRQRYWDGEQWTEHFAPGAAPATPQVAAHRNWFLRHRLITGIGAVLMVATFTSVASGSDKPITSSPVADSVAATAAAKAKAASDTMNARTAAGQAAAEVAARGKSAAAKAAAAKAAAAKPSASATALAAVAGLTVKGRAPKTGYTRAQFGQTWYDVDGNGCDTRNDILRRDLDGRQMRNVCKVLAGTGPTAAPTSPDRLR